MSDQSFLDWPFFEERHKELAIELDTWAKENISEEHSEDVDTACRQLVQQLAKDKWLEYCAPEPQVKKKKPLDVRSLCLIRETLSRHSGLADFAFAMQGLGSGSISLYGNNEIREKYLPAVRQGEKIAAFALSEPEAGSDVASLATTAEADGGDYIINGNKTWISNGGIADYYVIFARTGEAPEQKV